MNDDEQQPTAPPPIPVEPPSPDGSPLPPELAQADPGLLVDSVRGSGSLPNVERYNVAHPDSAT